MTSIRPTLFLTVGLPGTGKMTRAKRLARRHATLRLTLDDWMAPLFGHNDDLVAARWPDEQQPMS